MSGPLVLDPDLVQFYGVFKYDSKSTKRTYIYDGLNDV